MRTIEIIGDNHSAQWSRVRNACRAIVILDGKLLLSYASKIDCWMIPGGGKEADETDEACVVREVAEETGFRIRPIACFLALDEYYEDWKFASKYFLAEPTGETARRLTEAEIRMGLEPRWLPLEEIAAIYAKHGDAGPWEGLYRREHTALQAYMETEAFEGILAEIRESLLSLQDGKYRDFQLKLIPTVDAETVVGVRTPALRKLAKELIQSGKADSFLQDLPHRYFDENQLHAFILSEMKDFEACLRAVDRFLPYVDNWATCDQLSPRVFRRHRPELLAPIRRWIADGETYTQRFGLGMLMEHFLDGDFDPAYLALAASVDTEEYYVRMMVAWYFATALAKQYEAAVPYLEEGRLEPRTHNKTIQKATESNRISPERKAYLRGLRMKEMREK